MDFLDNSNKTRVFVSGWFTQEAYWYPWIPIPGSINQIFDLRVGPWSRTQVGWAESPWRSSRSSPGAFQIQNLKFIWFFCLDRKTTKRRNDKRQNNKTCLKRLICRQDHHSGTVPVRKRSFSFRTRVSSFRRFDRPPRQKRTFFCVK